MIASGQTSARVAGVINVAVSLVAVVYAYWQYRRRSTAILTRDESVTTACPRWSWLQFT
jgi:hypothetical protein